MTEMMDFAQLLFLMLIGHALADYPLQGDWLSKAKNPTLKLVVGETIWPMAMACHALIHAGAVLLVTGSWLLALGELVAHACIDVLKCERVINYNQDQILHVVCKVIWAGLIVWAV